MTRKRYTPEQIIRKLREAEVMISQREEYIPSYPSDWYSRSNLLQMAKRIRWYEGRSSKETKAPGKTEPAA